MLSECAAGNGKEGPPHLWIRWAALAFFSLLLWGFMFVVAPKLQTLSPVRSMSEYIRESNINASALYYTGVDETAEAEMYFYNADVYMPRGP